MIEEILLADDTDSATCLYFFLAFLDHLVIAYHHSASHMSGRYSGNILELYFYSVRKAQSLVEEGEVHGSCRGVNEKLFWQLWWARCVEEDGITITPINSCSCFISPLWKFSVKTMGLILRPAGTEYFHPTFSHTLETGLRTQLSASHI